MIEDKKSGLNDKGLNVYGAQQRLKLIGYSDVEATGIMDEITFNAVKHFQSAQGLYSYGIIDYTTKESLNQEVAEYAENLKEDAQLEKAIEILTK
jgi:carboxyl-terminal processing protease